MTRDADNRPEGGPMIEEQELRDALRPHRPEADEFARKVRERIDVAESRAQAPRSWLENAAAVLPPGFLTLKPALLTGSKGSAKGAVPALLAMPAISLMMLLLTFWAALRSIGRLSAAEADGSEQMVVDVRHWWSRHHFLAIASYALIFVLLIVRPADAFVLLLIVSMAALVILLRGISAAGLADQVNVSSRCLGLLIILGCVTFQFTMFVSERWTPVVLFAGAFLVALRGGLLRARYHRSKAAGIAAPVILLGFTLLTGWIALRPGVPDQEERRHQAESFDPSQGSPYWEEWSLCVAALADAGIRVDVSRAEAWLRERIAGNQEINPYIRRHAIRAGLLEADEWVAVRDASRAQRLLDTPGPIPFLVQEVSQLQALVHLPALDERQRDRLVSRLRETWSQDRRYNSFEEMLIVERTLEALGAAIDPAEARAEVHDALRRCWRADRRSGKPSGGFSNSPTLDHVDLEATFRGIELMVRHGVPDEIDLRQIEHYLHETSRTALPFFPRLQPAWLAAGASDLLDRRLEVPAVTPWELLLESRMLLGAVLLVLLSLHVTRSAPRVGPNGRTSAVQP